MTTETTPDAIEIALQVDRRASDALKIVQDAMDTHRWPAGMRIILWEAISRKAMGYAERCK